MKSKGIANDMAGAIANSTDSAERSDRTLGAARAWVDSSVNLQVCEQFVFILLLLWYSFVLVVFSAIIYIAEHSAHK